MFNKGDVNMDLGTVLIVDDEQPLRSLVRLYLEQEGFQVEEAVNGMDALLKIKDKEYKLLVLDLMMPELDGSEVCRQVRKSKKDMPIIMLTAKTEMEDKLAGFDIGADDYMGKPFDPRELVARIHALLRRTNTDDIHEVVHLSNLSINPSSHSVFIGDKILPLTAKEFDLLLLMAKNQGRVFSREQLLEMVWGQDFLGESRTVDSHVKNLREKLRNAGVDDLIHTVWAVGYKLEITND
jgi:two-component system response regulator ResD